MLRLHIRLLLRSEKPSYRRSPLRQVNAAAERYGFGVGLG
jgi:hypothetical protein